MLNPDASRDALSRDRAVLHLELVHELLALEDHDLPFLHSGWPQGEHPGCRSGTSNFTLTLKDVGVKERASLAGVGLEEARDGFRERN